MCISYKWCWVKILYSIHTKHATAHTNTHQSFCQPASPKQWINIVLLLLLCCPVAWCWQRQTQTSNRMFTTPVTPLLHLTHYPLSPLNSRPPPLPSLHPLPFPFSSVYSRSLVPWPSSSSIPPSLHPPLALFSQPRSTASLGLLTAHYSHRK